MTPSGDRGLSSQASTFQRWYFTAGTHDCISLAKRRGKPYVGCVYITSAVSTSARLRCASSTSAEGRVMYLAMQFSK